jgi:hypothetical protein
MLHKEVVDDWGVSGNGGMQMIRCRSSLRRISMLGLDRFISPIGGLHVLILLSVSISSSSSW